MEEKRSYPVSPNSRRSELERRRHLLIKRRLQKRPTSSTVQETNDEVKDFAQKLLEGSDFPVRPGLERGLSSVTMLGTHTGYSLLRPRPSLELEMPKLGDGRPIFSGKNRTYGRGLDAQRSPSVYSISSVMSGDSRRMSSPLGLGSFPHADSESQDQAMSVHQVAHSTKQIKEQVIKHVEQKTKDTNDVEKEPESIATKHQTHLEKQVNVKHDSEEKFEDIPDTNLKHVESKISHIEKESQLVPESRVNSKSSNGSRSQASKSSQSSERNVASSSSRVESESVKSAKEEIEELDLSDIRSFLMEPTPKSCGSVQCYIERNKVGASRKLFPEYHLFLKKDDIFLLAGKKRPKSRTSNYIVSMDANDMNRNSENCLGKLRANFIGTEFQFFTNGRNPERRAKDDDYDDDDISREDLGAVLYSSNILGARGPRKMRAAVPFVQDKLGKKDGMSPKHHAKFVPKDRSDRILSRLRDGQMEGLMELINKPPRWNDQVGAYVLNFNGRVTMASVKNFQLVLSEDEDRVVLQFGRVGKELFTMDYSWPLSPLQAFCLCLSSFDGKLACE